MISFKVQRESFFLVLITVIFPSCSDYRDGKRLNALVQIDGSSDDDDDDDDAGRGGSCELYDRFAAAFYCRSFSVCKGLQ